MAIITARADGETRKAKVAHEKCQGLERDVSRSLERIARLEFVVSEKTALVGELTRLAREQRARAEAAEKQQKLHVTSIGDDISQVPDGSHQTDDASTRTRDGPRRPRRGALAPAAAERRPRTGAAPQTTIEGAAAVPGESAADH